MGLKAKADAKEEKKQRMLYRVLVLFDQSTWAAADVVADHAFVAVLDALEYLEVRNLERVVGISISTLE